MDDILKRFDKPWINNSREIIKKKLDRMARWPSESLAQELEDIGITCDFSNQDHGTGPLGSNFNEE